MSQNLFDGVNEDLNVLAACLDTQTKVTSGVLESIWFWFTDVDINIPLPVMELEPELRNNLARSIIEELQTELKAAEAIWTATGDEDLEEGVASEELDRANNLWRELAGCFSEAVNELVPVVEFDTPEQEAAMYASLAEEIASSMDIRLEEVREYLSQNPGFRLVIRRSGLDPDRI